MDRENINSLFSRFFLILYYIADERVYDSESESEIGGWVVHVCMNAFFFSSLVISRVFT